MPDFNRILGPALIALQLEQAQDTIDRRLRVHREALADAHLRRLLARGPTHPDAISGLQLESPWWLAAQADTLRDPAAIDHLLNEVTDDLRLTAPLVLPLLHADARPAVVSWAQRHPRRLRRLLLHEDRSVREWAIRLIGDSAPRPDDETPSAVPRPATGSALRRLWRHVQGLPPAGADLRARWWSRPPAGDLPAPSAREASPAEKPASPRAIAR